MVAPKKTVTHTAKPRRARATGRLCDSLKSAAGALGLPEETLRSAKGAGCSAFRAGGRVHLDELSAWLKEHPQEAAAASGSPDTKRQLELDDLAEDVRRKKMANDQRARLLVQKSLVVGSIDRIGPQIKKLLDRLRVEYPAAVAGMDVPQARLYGGRLADEILAQIQSLETEWKTM
ncbi:MAG TPA: hypothetical protein VNO50_10885 [Pyrinomonadaceae bacterium]|nr:hypothetical protein [Pyrinomonadaceae bacterium]